MNVNGIASVKDVLGRVLCIIAHRSTHYEVGYSSSIVRKLSCSQKGQSQ